MYIPTKISLDMYYIIVGMKFKENNDLFLIIYKSCKKQVNTYFSLKVGPEFKY